MFKSKSNLGRKLDEVVKLKEKAKLESKRSKTDYINTSIKLGKSIVNNLQKSLDKLGDNINEEDSLYLADNIFKQLIETNYTSLEKAKDKFEFWNDLDEKFNS